MPLKDIGQDLSSFVTGVFPIKQIDQADRANRIGTTYSKDYDGGEARDKNIQVFSKELNKNLKADIGVFDNGRAVLLTTKDLTLDFYKPFKPIPGPPKNYTSNVVIKNIYDNKLSPELLDVSNLYDPRTPDILAVENVYDPRTPDDLTVTNLYDPREVQDLEVTNLYDPRLVQDLEVTNLYDPREVNKLEVTNLYDPREVAELEVTNLYAPREVQELEVTNLYDVRKTDNLKVQNVYDKRAVEKYIVANIYGETILPKNLKIENVYNNIPQQNLISQNVYKDIPKTPLVQFDKIEEIPYIVTAPPISIQTVLPELKLEQSISKEQPIKEEVLAPTLNKKYKEWN